ncbi:hypothetical protein KZX46_03435 (plasmid) [Polymorphobacter sp. PAMC 29334]|uniref:hypothetical protein n=1 Tax=Polymorphobacter sp. PAMC 29334 TaxID=2862331 RepID=UPI001C77AD3E|nr:hypothetical protein [Polymorphobacter sp. PAMC 29334]QYE33660.1 hypothetical protein KZX46_03435 [Polymorphobacter sp. PAMC 29334]
MELAYRTGRDGRQGRLMASPSHAFTARYAAEQLGANQDLIEEIEEIAAMQMKPEDGLLSLSTAATRQPNRLSWSPTSASSAYESCLTSTPQALH